MSIKDKLLPDNKGDIQYFSDEADRDRIITIIIEKIFDGLDIKSYQGNRGKNRITFYGMIVGFIFLGLILIYKTYEYTNDLLISCIPLLCISMILLYLINALRNPFTITLYKKGTK